MARIAKSLDVLRSEFNALAPNRKKTRDGWIGDAAHASRASRHNPNAEGVVCALDITDDVAGGCPVHQIAETLVARLAAGGHTNPDFEYVISNGHVASRTSGWTWNIYTGVDPHDLHCHFAVGRGPDSAPAAPYDDTIPWNIAPVQAQAAAPATPVQEDEDMTVIRAYADPKGAVHVYAVAGLFAKYLGDPTVVAAFRAEGVNYEDNGGKGIPAFPNQAAIWFTDGPLKNWPSA